MAERWAAALGVTVDDVVEAYRADKAALRVRLEAAGLDPATGFPAAGHNAPVRRTSAAQAVGIRLPDLSVDRLLAVGDHVADDNHDEVRGQDVNEPHDERDGDANAGGHEDDAVLTPSPTTADVVSS